MFDSAVNLKTLPPSDRLLLTGLHSVSDTICCNCGQSVGWTYNKCYERGQRYKEGRFIFELCKIELEVGGEDSEDWEDGGGWGGRERIGFGSGRRKRGREEEEEFIREY